MRNLKKVLSLALALVMLLGMMMVGAGAADTVAADIAEEHQEAATVLNAVKVVEGDNNGNMNGTGNLSRADATILIVRIKYGLDVEKLLRSNPADTDFTDVSRNHYASGVIAHCVEQDIVHGITPTTFAPNGTITGIDFATLVMQALGIEGDYGSGSGRTSKVLVALRENGLDDQVVVTTAPITREAAFQLMFNAIQYSPTGDIWKVGKVEFDNVKDASIYAAVTGGTVEQVPAKDTLAATMFGLTQNTTTDDFGREVRIWKLAGVKDPIYQSAESASAPVKVYTEKVKPGTVAKDLEGYTFDGEKKITVNGKADAAISAANIEAQIGNGKIVEVYANSADKVDNVVVIAPTVYPVTKVDEAKGTFTVGGVVIDEKSDFAGLIGQVEKDDKLVGVKNGSKFLSLEPAEIVTGTLTFLDKDKVATVDGEKITPCAGKTDIFDGLVGDEINVVMVNGYAWDAKAVEQTADTKAGDGYIYVTNVWAEASGKYGATNVAYAMGVLADGTTKTLTLAKTDSQAIAKGDYIKDETGNFTVSTNNGGTDGELLKLDTAAAKAIVDSTDANKALQGLYKYYEATGKDALLAFVGTGGTTAKKITGGANTGVKADAPQIDSKFVSSEVAMVLVSGSGDKLAGSVTARATIANSNDYYYILDEDGRVAVIFLKASASVNESGLVFVTATTGKTTYTDKDGKTKTGDVVTYYVPGEAEAKTMTVSDWTDAKANKYFNATENGTGFALGGNLEASTEVKYDEPVKSMYNGNVLIGTDTVVSVADALVVDLRGDKNNVITSAEELEAWVNDDVTVKKVTMIIKDNAASTIYLLASKTTELPSGGATAENIGAALELGKPVEIKQTISESVTMDKGTLVLGTGSSIAQNKTVTVGEGATVEVKVAQTAATGQIKLDGGTIKASGSDENTVTTLPKLGAGSTGTIEVTGNKVQVAHLTGNDADNAFGTNGLAALTNKVAPAASAGKDVTDGKEYTITITDADKKLVFKGDGYMESYSGSTTVNNIAKWFGATEVYFKTIDLKNIASTNQKVKVQFFNGETPITLQYGTTADGKPDPKMYGTGEDPSNAPTGDDKTILLPFGGNVTKIVITVTGTVSDS